MRRRRGGVGGGGWMLSKVEEGNFCRARRAAARGAKDYTSYSTMRFCVLSVSGDSGGVHRGDGVATADAATLCFVLLVRTPKYTQYTLIYILRAGGRGKMPGKAKGPGPRGASGGSGETPPRIRMPHRSRFARTLRAARVREGELGGPELSNFLFIFTARVPHSNFVFVVKLSRLSGVSAEAGPRQGRLALLSPPHNYQRVSVEAGPRQEEAWLSGCPLAPLH